MHMRLNLCFSLLVVFATVAVAQPPQRFRQGTGAPASTACDAASEVGSIYIRVGDPATVPTSFQVCTQTGASSYAWNPSSGKVATTAPATCVVGDLFFDSDATAGQNLYGCTATDTWTLLTGGAGGATTSQDLTDLEPTKDSGTQITVDNGIYGANTETFTHAGTVITRTQLTITAATAANPMVVTVSAVPSSVQIGDQLSIAGATGTGCSGMNAVHPVSAKSGTTVTLTYNNTGCTYDASSATLGSNSSATGTVMIYGDSSGVVIVSHPSAAGLILTCTGSCQASQDDTPVVADDGVQIAEVTLNGTGGGNFNVLTDTRVFLNASGAQAGFGITITPSGGLRTIAVNTAVVPDKTANDTITGTWDYETGGLKVPRSTTLPGTCAVGQVYQDTNATATAQWYLCTATDTWTAQGGGTTETKSPYHIRLRTMNQNSGGTANPADGVNVPTSGGATAVTGGTNPYRIAGLQFADAADSSVNFHFFLPTDWDGGTVSLRISWWIGSGASSSQVVKWEPVLDCIGAGEAYGDHTFSSRQSMDGTLTSATVTLLHITTLSSVTMNGCAAGEEAVLNIQRNGDDAGDTATANAVLLEVELRMLITGVV